MIQFILMNALFISIGGIIYIILKTLPQIEEVQSPKESFLEKFIISELPHKIDAIFNFYLSKILRRLKILVLKLDNYLSEKLKNININGNSENKKIDFWGLGNKEETSKNENEEKTLLSE
jgi:hypothetical protein